MKKLFLFLLCLPIFVFAQDGINYQGAATDNNGDELINQNITLRASVISGSINGNLEWEETHYTSTDQFGLFSVVIGQGTNTSNGSTSNFDNMDWGSGNHFLKIEMDASGGTNYSIIGTTQMMSVPYALYAKSTNYDTIATILLNDSSFSNSISGGGSGNLIVSTFGDTLTLNGQSIIVPGISFSNVVPTFGSISDIDGNTYQTVSYGNVEWMVDNLIVTQFNDGTQINPNCQTGTSGGQPGWCYYDSDYMNYSQYGKLYNGHTLYSGKNVCPTGWHVSNANDWDVLTDLFITNGTGTNGIGSSSTGSASPLLLSQTNESYLSLQLAGANGNGGSGYSMGQAGHYWLEDLNLGGNFYTNIYFDSSLGFHIVYLGSASLWDYKYVRCVKD